jgi:hypothetical protein
MTPKAMTPSQLYDARQDLGFMWGKSRPLHASELGRALRLGGRDPGFRISKWEKSVHAIPGPVSVAIEAMLAGFKPKYAYWKPLYEGEKLAGLLEKTHLT